MDLGPRMNANVLIRACNRPTSTPITIPNSNACWHNNLITKQVRNRIIFTAKLSSALLPNWLGDEVRSSVIRSLHTTRQKPNLSAMWPPTTAGGQVYKSNMAAYGQQKTVLPLLPTSGIRREAKVCPYVTAWLLPSCVLLDGHVYGFDIVPQYLPLQM